MFEEEKPPPLIGGVPPRRKGALKRKDAVEPGEITVVSAPVQREGFVEQVITTYARQEPEKETKPSRAKRRSRA